MSDAFPPLGSGREGNGHARRRQPPNPYRSPTERDFDPYPSRLVEIRRRAIEHAYAAEDAQLEQGRSLNASTGDEAPGEDIPRLNGIGFLSSRNFPAPSTLDLDAEFDEEPTRNRPQMSGMSRVTIKTPGQAKQKARRKRKATDNTQNSLKSSAATRSPVPVTGRSGTRTPLYTRLVDRAHQCLGKARVWDRMAGVDGLGSPQVFTDRELDVVLSEPPHMLGLDVQLHNALLQVRRIRATRAALARAAFQQQSGSSSAYSSEVRTEEGLWEQVDQILDTLLSSPESLVRCFSPIRVFPNHSLHGIAGAEEAPDLLSDSREAEANRFSEWFADLARPFCAKRSQKTDSEGSHRLQQDPGDQIFVKKTHEKLHHFLQVLSVEDTMGPAWQNLNLVALILVRWVFAPLICPYEDDSSLWTLYLSAFAFHASASNLLWLHVSPAGPAYARTRLHVVFQDLHDELDATLLALFQSGPPHSQTQVRERLLACRIGLSHFHRASRACLFAPALAQGADQYPFGSEVLDEHASRVIRLFFSRKKQYDAWFDLVLSEDVADGVSFSFELKHRLIVNAASFQSASAADSVVWDEMTASAGRLRSSSDNDSGSEEETWDGRVQNFSSPSHTDPDTSSRNVPFEAGLRIVAATAMDRALAEHGLLDFNGSSRRLHVCIRRGFLVQDSIALFSQLAQTIPDARQLPLSVSWAGEEAVDGGGPRREWISSLVATLTTQLGSTSEDGPGAWLDRLDKPSARALGCALGLSLLHDVPTRPGLPYWLFRCLLVGPGASSAHWSLTDVEQNCDPDLAQRMFLYIDRVGELVTSPDPDRIHHIATVRLERMRETQEHVANAVLGAHYTDDAQSIEPQLDALIKGFAWMTQGLPLHLLGPNDLRAMLSGSESVDPFSQSSSDENGDHQEVADKHLISTLRQATRHVGFSSTAPGDIQLQDQFWAIFISDWDASQRSALLAFITGAPGLPSGWHRHFTSGSQLGERGQLSQVDTQSDVSVAPAMTVHLVDDPAFASYVPWSSTCTSTLFIPRMSSDELGPRLKVALQNATAGFGLK